MSGLYLHEFCYREEFEVYKGPQDLSDYRLDTTVISGLLWSLALFSGKYSGIHGSAWLVACV